MNLGDNMRESMFPAQAGMNRVLHSGDTPSTYVPRAGGDDDAGALRESSANMFPSRARGLKQVI